MSKQALPLGIDVDETALRFRAPDGVVLDVLFDEHRVWSFDTDDHPVGGDGLREVAWPEPIRTRLDGHSRIGLREHVSGAMVGSLDAHFGTSEDRIAMVDGSGRPLSLTKWGRLNRSFATTDRAIIEGYLDQVEAVLAVLRDDCGVPAFLSFGSLLGAVREGKLIGHDVDVDLGYFSSEQHPADVMLESFRIERVLRSKGWRVVRENGGFLALFFKQADGTTRNLDIFTAFRAGDRLFQVHDVATHADESAVLPLGTIDFEGRPMPVPAVPEVFLEAAYGPDWRIPNPAFKFSTPQADRRRVAGWFGGLRGRRDFWREFYGKFGDRVPRKRTTFAAWVADREPAGTLVDVGCGNGRDSWFFAARGFDVTGLTLLPRLATKHPASRRQEAAPDIEQCNLDSLRQTLATGARLARLPGDKVVYGRFVLNNLTDAGRANFWRLTAMTLSGGGRCYLEFRTLQDRALPKEFGPHFRRHLHPDRVVAEAAARGGRVVHREAGRGLSPLGAEDPHLCRLILEWSR